MNQSAAGPTRGEIPRRFGSIGAVVGAAILLAGIAAALVDGQEPGLGLFYALLAVPYGLVVLSMWSTRSAASLYLNGLLLAEILCIGSFAASRILPLLLIGPNLVVCVGAIGFFGDIRANGFTAATFVVALFLQAACLAALFALAI